MAQLKTSKKPTVPFSTRIGAYLRDKREGANLSQFELAKKLGLKSAQMVSNWERGLCGPSFKNLVKTAHICKISETELLEELMNEQRVLFKKQLKKRA